MKKITAIITAAVMLMSCLCGCGANTALNENENSLKIVTTIFPEYDWVMNILGDKANKAQVTMLLDNGVDLHSSQPTAQDIMKISTCDLFIYVGGESDEWVEDALKEATSQIITNKYESKLIYHGFTKRLKYGMAFFDKSVLISKA